MVVASRKSLLQRGHVMHAAIISLFTFTTWFDIPSLPPSFSLSLFIPFVLSFYSISLSQILLHRYLDLGASWSRRSSVVSPPYTATTPNLLLTRIGACNLSPQAYLSHRIASLFQIYVHSSSIYLHSTHNTNPQIISTHATTSSMLTNLDHMRVRVLCENGICIYVHIYINSQREIKKKDTNRR